MDEKIVFFCHSCTRRYRAPSSSAGKEFDCAGCKSKVRIPKTSQVPREGASRKSGDTQELPALRETESDRPKDLRSLFRQQGGFESLVSAFADIRADLDIFNEGKLYELSAWHVEETVGRRLDHLLELSRSSSGCVRASRGMGKSHLMLHAWQRCRKDFVSLAERGGTPSNLIIYMDLAEFASPGSATERLFATALARSFTEQLRLYCGIDGEGDQDREGVLKKFFGRSEERIGVSQEKLDSAVNLLEEIESIARTGRKISEFGNIETDRERIKGGEKSAGAGVSLSRGVHLGADISSRAQEFEKWTSSEVVYFPIDNVRRCLCEISRLFGLRSITIFLDSWIAIEKDQRESISMLVKQIMGDPLFFWISIVPENCDMGALEIGHDLGHVIDLDDRIVYENLHEKGRRTRGVFEKSIASIINRRLASRFGEGYANWQTLFGKRDWSEVNECFVASMGNWREFLRIVLKSCLRTHEAFDYTVSGNQTGIGIDQVRESIDEVAQEKRFRLSRASEGIRRLWEILFDNVQCSGHMHFLIQFDPFSWTDEPEFLWLQGNGLIHKRGKKTLDAKPYLVFALDYGVTYPLHEGRRASEYSISPDTKHVWIDVKERYDRIGVDQASKINLRAFILEARHKKDSFIEPKSLAMPRDSEMPTESDAAGELHERRFDSPSQAEADVEVLE